MSSLSLNNALSDSSEESSQNLDWLWNTLSPGLRESSLDVAPLWSFQIISEGLGSIELAASPLGLTLLSDNAVQLLLLVVELSNDSDWEVSASGPFLGSLSVSNA